MPSGQGRVPAWLPILVATLAGANVLLLALSLHCLRILGEEEVKLAGSYELDVDFAGLYDPLPLAAFAGSQPPAQALHGGDAKLRQPKKAILDESQSPDAIIAATEKRIVELAKPPLPSSLPPQPPPSPPPRPPPPPAPGPGPDASGVACSRPSGTENVAAAAISMPCQLPILSVAEGGSGSIHAGSKKMCGACTGPVRGLIPTTLRQTLESQQNSAPSMTSSCTWQLYTGSFLYDLVNGVSKQASAKEAKDMCMDHGNACRGVVCDSQGEGCTMRSGNMLHASALGERTFVKVCPEPPASDAIAADSSSCPGSPASETSDSTDPSAVEHLRGAAIVILAHNRADDLRKSLHSLLALKEISLFKVFVSLDDAEAAPTMQKTVAEKADEHKVSVGTWLHDKRKFDPKNLSVEKAKWFTKFNTAKIAWHYWCAFEKVFQDLQHNHAIFVEEDLIFSPDFLALFRSTAWLLKTDPSIGCVSAWNDNGFPEVSEDPCRLTRTSYFPGLGFLLPREVWATMRKWWTDAPTMGWDYWMRVAFRRAGLECIIPEVPRSHHISEKGSSVNTARSAQLFKMMTFADVPSICSVDRPCKHFGDVSYLLEAQYDERLRSAIQSAPRMFIHELKSPKDKAELYIMPYKIEEFPHFIHELGLRPKSHHNIVPKDIRAEHYGAVLGRHKPSNSWVLAVDRRSKKQLLPTLEQIIRNPAMIPVTGSSGVSCAEACTRQSQTLTCDADQMHFLNDCNEMKRVFPCEEGCAHQVGKELPAYVTGSTEATFRQCLVTFISPMGCSASHPNTARLCACTKH